MTKLSLHPIMRSRFNNEPVGTGPIVEYSVDPLPQDLKVFIADFGTQQPTWRILREEKGQQGQWEGNYETAEDALAAVQKQMDE